MPSEKSNIMTAALWMGGALLSFTMMALGGREASAELNTFQILFYRSVIGLVIVSALLSKSGWGQIRTKQMGTHVIRNLAHYIGQYGWFYGIALIPLAEVFAIEFTTPIWMAILAIFILDEKLTRSRIMTILLGFVGVLIILRPGVELFDLASFAVLIAAIGYAFAHIFTKKLSREDSPLSIIFYMIAIQLPLGFLPSLDNWVWPSTTVWIWLTILGATALSAHYCIARAFQHADATVIIPIDFLRLPLVMTVGYLLYAEQVDIWVLIGAIITVGANVLNLKKEHKREADR